MTPIQIYIMADHPGAQMPSKAHPSDAGWDLFVSREAEVPSGEARDIHTDICIALPEGYFANIKPRSSTLVRYGLEVIEGVVDQGYRGELFIQVRNTAQNGTYLTVPAGHRIAQLLILPVPNVQWHRVESLPHSLRGAKGFGQSGR